MLMRHASAARNQLAAGTVAVAICHRAIRVVVIGHRSHVAFVPVISQVILPSPSTWVFVAGIDASENVSPW